MFLPICPSWIHPSDVWQPIAESRSMQMPESVLRLIELTYESAIDPDVWPRLLNALSDTLGGAGADLAAFDTEKAATRIHAGAGIIDPEFQQEYLSYVWSDPFYLRARAQRLFRAGTIGVGEDLVPMRELVRTEFHNDFGKRHDYIGGLSAVVAADETSGAVVSVCRCRDRLFGEAEVGLMRVLMPHLKRALQVHARLVDAVAPVRSFEHLLNRLTSGAMLVQQSGTVAFVNDRAREIVAQRDGLMIDRGMLRAERVRDTSRLLNLIGGAAATSAGEGLHAGGVMLLGRPSGRRPLQIVVSPIPRQSGIRGLAHRASAVFILDPEHIPEAHGALLVRLHGFSRAEADVGQLLLQGKTVKEVADRLCVTVNTVRFHLKQLFSKTGARRQSELIRLLSTIAFLKCEDAETGSGG
jgi:DNA-binding CsgD family transcriptional regulator